MKQKQLVIFPPGSISAIDRQRMMNAGFLPIEAAEPSKVVVAIPGQSFGDTDLLKSALYAMCESPARSADMRAAFVSQLWKSMSPEPPKAGE